ncbi:YqjF family protein [Oceanobacillus sp. CF4.6]|uniref:YqjF family protein n=1 Tax=Oceanobacillus sp. CF4.6 TaxID=3373080 RepID=UPI003EE6E777
MYKDILQKTEHRDDPLPDGPWLATQRWNHLLFMHLPVPKDIINKYIPMELVLDTYDGSAWITIIPFKVNNMRPRKMPPIPFLHSYLELNVRTYVKQKGVKGIYFFSLDANKLLAVLGARVATLPYFYANMKMKKKKDIFYFDSTRKGKSNASFKGSYRPTSEAYYPEKSSLNYWLLERYILWTYRNNFLFRGDIHHKRWKICDVEANIETEDMMPFLPDDTVIGNPIFHYAYSRRVLFWPIKKVDE